MQNGLLVDGRRLSQRREVRHIVSARDGFEREDSAGVRVNQVLGGRYELVLLRLVAVIKLRPSTARRSIRACGGGAAGIAISGPVRSQPCAFDDCCADFTLAVGRLGLD